MRRMFIAAPLLIAPALALAAPAAAQDADDWGDEPYADEAGDLPPATNADIWDDDPYADTDETVLAVDRLVGALLDMPVGRLASLAPEAEMARGVREGDTLRDVMGRDNPEFETRVRGGARALTGMIGEMTRRLTTMMPELDSWARRMRRSTED